MRTPLLATAVMLALVLMPAATAHGSDPHAKSATPPLEECSGMIDFACFHTECPTPQFCIRLFCPVYVGHNGGTGLSCFPH